MQDLLQNIWLSLDEGQMVLGMMVDRRMMYFALSVVGRECWTCSSFCLIFCRIFGSLEHSISSAKMALTHITYGVFIRSLETFEM